MMKNDVKAKIHNNEAAVGVFIASLVPSPAMVEILGESGFDFVILDAEHGAMDLGVAENLVRAAEIGGIVPLVRVPGISHQAILPFLDMGMMGVQVPHVKTRADAEAVVRLVKFYPEGERGLTSRSRAAHYGIGTKPTEYLREANAATMVVLQLEEKEALDNLDDILTVEGVDVFFLAPGDLSQSLGIPAQYDHPDLKKAVEETKSRILRAGRQVGAMATDAKSALSAIDGGVNYITIRGAGLLQLASKSILSGIEEARPRSAK